MTHRRREGGRPAGGSGPGAFPPDLLRLAAYHRRSSLAPERAAAAPSRLVRATEPVPFRRYAGVERIPLAGEASLPLPVPLGSLAGLLRDSLGISAWRASGEARFALRVVPSAGNLHPLEAYVLAAGPDGTGELLHYSPFDDALERLGPLPPDLFARLPPPLAVMWTALPWRTSWKYGERAFRLIHLDAGHALAAVALAAEVRGLRPRLVDAPVAALEALLPLRSGEVPDGREVGVALLTLGSEGPGTGPLRLPPALRRGLRERPPAEPEDEPPRSPPWPGCRTAFRVTGGPVGASGSPPESETATPERPAIRLAELDEATFHGLVHRRRSHHDFDPEGTLGSGELLDLLAATVGGAAASLGFGSDLRIFLFVHGVEDRPPGLYDVRFRSSPAPALRCLGRADLRDAARTLAGGQDAAARGVATAVLAAPCRREVERHGAGAYRRLHWEAGAVVHHLYLQATARGLGVTGLSGFYDGLLADALGLRDGDLMPLYLVALGRPTADERAREASLLPPDLHRRQPVDPSPPSRGGFRPRR